MRSDFLFVFVLTVLVVGLIDVSSGSAASDAQARVNSLLNNPSVGQEYKVTYLFTDKNTFLILYQSMLMFFHTIYYQRCRDIIDITTFSLCTPDRDNFYCVYKNRKCDQPTFYP